MAEDTTDEVTPTPIEDTPAETPAEEATPTPEPVEVEQPEEVVPAEDTDAPEEVPGGEVRTQGVNGFARETVARFQ